MRSRDARRGRTPVSGEGHAHMSPNLNWLDAPLGLTTPGRSGRAVPAGAHDVALGPGSANFVNGPAMTDAQLAGALEAGRQSVERALGCGAQLYIGGDMGIGNTTAAAALGCALLSVKPEALAGPGTGLDERGVVHKEAVMRRELEKH